MRVWVRVCVRVRLREHEMDLPPRSLTFLLDKRWDEAKITYDATIGASLRVIAINPVTAAITTL